MKNLYLQEREQRVFSGLLRSGPVSIADLAKMTLINRTTLYPILEKLLEKGLVTKLQVDEVTIFRAISLQELAEWTTRKEQESKAASGDLLSWAQSQSQEPQTSLRTEIKYFQGLEGVMNLYDDTWRDNQDKMIYALTDYEQAYKVVGDAFLRDGYFQRRVRHGVRVQSLLPESPIGRKELKIAKQLLREMRFIDLFEDLGIEINVYDNKVAIFAFDPTHPSGVLIQNELISKAFKQIFQYLWKSAKKG